MDQRTAPILDALEEYHRLGRYGYPPPGHRQGRGVDKRTLDVLGADTFRNDVLASAGLDDRSSSNGYPDHSRGPGIAASVRLGA